MFIGGIIVGARGTRARIGTPQWVVANEVRLAHELAPDGYRVDAVRASDLRRKVLQGILEGAEQVGVFFQICELRAPITYPVDVEAAALALDDAEHVLDVAWAGGDQFVDDQVLSRAGTQQ